MKSLSKSLFTSLSKRNTFKFSAQEVDKFLTGLNSMSTKIKQKQTVADKKNLKKFLQTQLTQGKLQTTLNRTAQYDTEFNQFLDSYKEKHREFPNIIDLSQYTRDEGLFSKTADQRKDELVWIEEFRKRQQKKIYNQHKEKIFEDDEPDDMFNTGDKNQDQKSRVPTFGEKLYDRDEFVVIVIDKGTTTLVTTLNRINHFRYLIFMGNANGVIGYGKGKGLNFEEAFDKAIANCKKNLISVNLDHFLSLPQTLEESYYGCKIKIEPRKSFHSWGHPTVSAMILLTGITHCRFELNYRNLNPYAMTFAFFKCVTQNYTPQQIAEIYGQKIYRRNFGKPVYLNNFPLEL